MFRELYRDWKWIFAFAWNRKGLVILYTLLGIAITTSSIGISCLGKVLINTVVKSEYQGFVLIAVAYGIGIALIIAVNAVTSRLSAKINIYITYKGHHTERFLVGVLHFERNVKRAEKIFHSTLQVLQSFQKF